MGIKLFKNFSFAPIICNIIFTLHHSAMIFSFTIKIHLDYTQLNNYIMPKRILYFKDILEISLSLIFILFYETQTI